LPYLDYPEDRSQPNFRVSFTTLVFPLDLSYRRSLVELRRYLIVMSTAIPEDMPAMEPPDGQVSNFDDPPSLHAWTLGVGITCMALMTLAVAIRTYTKAIILREMRHEDYVALVALVGFLAWGAIYIYLSSIGLTRDLWNIRAMDMSYLLYMANVFQIVYPIAMGAAKYFICVQLKRIFCPSQSSRTAAWWALQSLIVATIMYYISCFFTFLFQCTPREKIWNPAIDGTCIDNNAGVLSAGLINLILDLGILIVPCWALWHLQLPMKRKLGAISIFAVGVFTCAIAAAGVAYRIPLLTEANQTAEIARVGLWTFAELAGTMIVGCMPMFPRFYEHSIIVQGPTSIFRSVKSLLSTSSQITRETQVSKGSQFSKGSRANKSTDRIVITSQFTMEDTRNESDYIELRDSEQQKSNWRTFDAV
jgi:hypothetical protein